MYREKISIWTLLGKSYDDESRHELLRRLGSYGGDLCPGIMGGCSKHDNNCEACWADVLDHVEEVTIRCDV